MQKPCLACWRNRERSPGGRSRVKGGEEREEVRAGRGQEVLQGRLGHGEDLSFYPEEDGSPGGLRAKEGLTCVITGTIW